MTNNLIDRKTLKDVRTLMSGASGWTDKAIREHPAMVHNHMLRVARKTVRLLKKEVQE
jgi:hypothetical protein